MAKLICELNLLQYKQSKPQDFEKYVQVQLDNYETMILRMYARENAKKPEENPDFKLPEQVRKGMQEFSAIAEKVRATQNIQARMDEIREVAEVDQDTLSDASESLPSSPTSSPQSRKSGSIDYDDLESAQLVRSPSALDLTANLSAQRSHREEARRNIDNAIKDNLSRMMAAEGHSHHLRKN